MRNLFEANNLAAQKASAIVWNAISNFRWRPSGGSDRYRRRTMFRKSLLISGIVLALFGVSAPLLAKHAPDDAFKTLDGQKRKLSALRGQAAVVNFWATWCVPCREELPRLSQIADAYAGKPVSFVFISIDDEKARAKIPAALSGVHFARETWVGADTDTLDRFGLGNIVPGTAVLDEKGEIVSRVMGEAREEDVRKAVDWLLGGKQGAPPAALTKRF